MNIEDIMKVAMAELHYSPLCLFEMTPYEINLALEGVSDKNKRDAELMKHSVAFGIASVLNKKDIKMFVTEALKKVDPHVKNETLNELIEKFGGDALGDSC